MPPYPLPANKEWSGVKTRSTKGGTQDNYNEIRLEDSIGKECSACRPNAICTFSSRMTAANTS